MVFPGKWTRGAVEDLAAANEVRITMLEPADVFCRAIVGYDVDDCSLVYDYDLMVEALAESLEAEGTCTFTEDDGGAYAEAADVISSDTMRAIGYMPEPRPKVICGGEDFL